MFDVEEPNVVESVGVNTALSRCVPDGNVVFIDALPPETGATAPMLVLSCITAPNPRTDPDTPGDCAFAFTPGPSG